MVQEEMQQGGIIVSKIHAQKQKLVEQPLHRCGSAVPY